MSFDMMANQTMNELFAQKKCYDVNLFVIVDDAFFEHGCQYSCVYGESARHSSNTVASLLCTFFEWCSPAVGRAQVQHLHSD